MDLSRTDATSAQQRDFRELLRRMYEGRPEGERDGIIRQGVNHAQTLEPFADLLGVYRSLNGGRPEAAAAAAVRAALGAGLLRTRSAGDSKARDVDPREAHANTDLGPKCPEVNHGRGADAAGAVTSTDARWIPDVFLRGNLPGFVDMLRASASSVLDGRELSEGDLVTLCLESVRGLLIQEQRRNGGKPLHPLTLVSWFQQTAALAEEQPAGVDLAGKTDATRG